MIACTKESKVSEEDRKTKAKLILKIDPSLYVHIRNVATTYDLWTKLKGLFDENSQTCRNAFCYQF